jgi:serine/threonine-protein kinase
LAQAMVLLANGRREEADKALQAAQDLDPLNADAFRWRGDYHFETDRAKAEAAYLEAVRLAPDDWRTHQFLGRFYYQNARYEDAEREWERARELSPDNLLVLRNLGGVYHALDRTDAAAAAFQRALEIEPSATAYSNVGTMRFFQGRYTDAAAAFEKAVELNPTYYLYWGNLGDAYRWIPGQDGKAREAFARATTLAEERLKTREADVSLRGSLAGYLAKRGEKAKALDQVRRIEEAAERSPAVYFKTATVYEITGDRDRALRDLETALQNGYSTREIVNDAELLQLRSDSRYHRMLARFDK